jgi:hypothetical protein
MKMRLKELTEEQKAKAAARKAAFRELWKKVAAAPELERIQLANRLGLRTCEGHELSLCNTMLVALQCPTASVLGGFRQWLKMGRAVRKGEHGAMIWVPTSKKTAAADTGAAQPENGEATDETRFIIGTLFDIAQTDEVQTN